jgi:hypothetical protein
LSRAEAGELTHMNVAVAIGQALRPESDAQATIGRACVLRALQRNCIVPARSSRDIFERAASFPFEQPPEKHLDLDSLAHLFADSFG